MTGGISSPPPIHPLSAWMDVMMVDLTSFPKGSLNAENAPANPAISMVSILIISVTIVFLEDAFQGCNGTIHLGGCSPIPVVQFNIILLQVIEHLAEPLMDGLQGFDLLLV